MLLSTRLKLLITVWIVCEVLVFVGAAHLVGIGWVLIVGVATTLFGASLLKRAGAAALTRLREPLQERHDGRHDGVLDGTLKALAAAALILPGFLSDAVGLALSIRAVRARATRWVRGGGLGVRFKDSDDRPGPRTIELGRDEWTHARPRDEGDELPR